MTRSMELKRLPAPNLLRTAVFGVLFFWLPAGVAQPAVWESWCLNRPVAGQPLCGSSAGRDDCGSCKGVPRSGLLFAAANGVSVPEAWARASAGAASTGAAYVTLVGGAEPDQLVGVSTPVAAMAEVHETINDNGVMKMRPVPAISIPAGETVAFVPGGYHIMLTGLKQPLAAGQSFPLTLVFAREGQVTLDVQVRATAGHDQMPMK